VIRSDDIVRFQDQHSDYNACNQQQKDHPETPADPCSLLGFALLLSEP
jgi:hypothetical protein